MKLSRSALNQMQLMKVHAVVWLICLITVSSQEDCCGDLQSFRRRVCNNIDSCDWKPECELETPMPISARLILDVIYNVVTLQYKDLAMTMLDVLG